MTRVELRLECCCGAVFVLVQPNVVPGSRIPDRVGEFVNMHAECEEADVAGQITAAEADAIADAAGIVKAHGHPELRTILEGIALRCGG